MSSKQPLLLDDEGPRRAPDSDDENNAGAVGGATGGQRATGGATTQMNDDFLRVNLPPPSSQQSSVPYPQQQQPTQQKPQGQSQLNTTAARPQPVPAMAPGYQYVQVPVYNVWTDPNVLGQLALTVERASLTKNYGLTNMSPYCRIRVGHNMCKTKTVDGAGKTPCWNQRIALPLTKGVDMAYIEIFDSCVLQNDQMVAWGCVPIPEELLIAGGDEASKAYSLSGKQGPNLEGTVHVRLSFVLSKDMAAMGNASQPQPYTMMMPPGGAAMYTPYAPYQMYPPPVMTPYAMAGTTNVHVQPQNYPQMQGTMPQPQQPRAPPVISEADVTSLKETFPAVDREVIAGVLENCSGNKDAAAELLLQMG